MINIKDFKQVYDYRQFQAHMQSNLKRTGEYRTFTPVDYFTKEEIDEFNKKGINNLEPYLPVPESIRKHNQFSLKLRADLSKKHPNDEFLKELFKEKYIEFVSSYAWYEKYGIIYHG